jgi:ATP/maltotriose-dependent transcriptional regulator MalT
MQAGVEHIRASEWFEANGFEIEAVGHAAAGHQVRTAPQQRQPADQPPMPSDT